MRLRYAHKLGYLPGFQSTHPARGATIASFAFFFVALISIHAPREGCDPEGGRAILTTGISIHAPREGCDLLPITIFLGFLNFNPRTPRGVRPRFRRRGSPSCYISIHAPREGCDKSQTLASSFFIAHFNPRTPRGVRRTPLSVSNSPIHFNPRTPRGVRRDSSTTTASNTKFQSTHPARGATDRLLTDIGEDGISIHAPREGCDSKLY